MGNSSRQLKAEVRSVHNVNKFSESTSVRSACDRPLKNIRFCFYTMTD